MMVVPRLFKRNPALPNQYTVVLSDGPKASAGSATVSLGIACPAALRRICTPMSTSNDGVCLGIIVRFAQGHRHGRRAQLVNKLTKRANRPFPNSP
jgi:hypothetical protein